jgi:protein-S-isoprenylcysteine O-methyltransferase Ste14
MEIMGKPTLNPFIFYTGKISGYVVWLAMLLSLLRINFIEKFSYGYNDYVSFVLLIPGLILIAISLINLGSSVRFGLPVKMTKFKTNGLYKISRNPMYLGFALITIASMIYMLNLIVIVLGIYSLTIYHLIVLAEEKFLEKRFGSEYSNYLKKVRRYL